jgi:hypothetical protein
MHSDQSSLQIHDPALRIAKLPLELNLDETPGGRIAFFH